MGLLNSFANSVSASAAGSDSDSGIITMSTDTANVPVSAKKLLSKGYKLKTVIYNNNLRQYDWVFVLPECAA